MLVPSLSWQLTDCCPWENGARAHNAWRKAFSSFFSPVSFAISCSEKCSAPAAAGEEADDPCANKKTARVLVWLLLVYETEHLLRPRQTSSGQTNKRNKTTWERLGAVVTHEDIR